MPPFTCTGCNVHSTQAGAINPTPTACYLCKSVNAPSNDTKCLLCRKNTRSESSKFCGNDCRKRWACTPLPPVGYKINLPNVPAGGPTVRIVHISDTHRNLDCEAVKKAIGVNCVNILVHSGDYTLYGHGADEFFQQMISLDGFQYKIIISGNHDSPPLTDPEFEWKAQEAGVIHLVDEEIEVSGLRFYGTPWTMSKVAFCCSEQDLNEKFDAIPAGTDVLIAHNPPSNVMDLGVEAGDHTQRAQYCPICRSEHQDIWRHRGSAQLLSVVERLKIPAVLFGHVHDTTGTHKTAHTLFSNGATAGATVELFDIHQTTHRPPICTIDIPTHAGRLHGFPCCSPSKPDAPPPLLRLPNKDTTQELHTFPIKGWSFIMSPQGDGLSADFCKQDLLNTKMVTRENSPRWTIYRLARNPIRRMNQGNPPTSEHIVQAIQMRSPDCVEILQSLVDHVLRTNQAVVLCYIGITPPGEPYSEAEWRFLDEDLFSPEGYVCLYPYRARANQVWKFDPTQWSIQSLATGKYLGRNVEGRPVMYDDFTAATCQWFVSNLTRPQLVM